MELIKEILKDEYLGKKSNRDGSRFNDVYTDGAGNLKSRLNSLCNN